MPSDASLPIVLVGRGPPAVSGGGWLTASWDDADVRDGTDELVPIFRVEGLDAGVESDASAVLSVEVLM
uniref:Uncharacterized protein n=1 Tax=uncultured bacterium A1Q1_fos_515 TaxID=1256581 RepID=L7VYT8_9BACT|nr:hypothetical protein [uncultured bacterium A1Q1_fos_515]